MASTTQVLLIDNYDSFTFNLVQYLGELGAEVVVRRNDAMSSSEAVAMSPDCIVLSPGPCGPERAGICMDLTKAATERQIPLLGICLGHQAIGQAFGGRVIRNFEIVHGKTDDIFHDNAIPMNGLPSPFRATRYHSLTVERESVPDVLEVTAWTETGTIMGLRHRREKVFGLQFHPESIATEHGYILLSQFLDEARNGS